MKEKYIKADVINAILNRLSREASDQWDMDGVIMCGRFRAELETLPGECYVELETAEKDKL